MTSLCQYDEHEQFRQYEPWMAALRSISELTDKAGIGLIFTVAGAALVFHQSSQLSETQLPMHHTFPDSQ